MQRPRRACYVSVVVSAGDIVIVGGGPAGLSTALFLAARAPALRDRIVVLERARYPREKPCAGAIGGRADRALATIGVHVDVPSVIFSAMHAKLTSGNLSGSRASIGIGRVVRRSEFDAELARIARSRGIRIVEGARVVGVDWHARHATLRIDGSPARHVAVVVGADGVGSIVRREMKIPFGRLRAQVVEVDTEWVASDLPPDHLAFDFSNASFAGYTWDFPTIIDAKSCVCRGAYVLSGSRHHPRGPDPEAILDAHLTRLGLDSRRYSRRRFAERGLSISSPVSCPHGLLVGEAAGIDPVLGEGIAQGILYGALAARYLAKRVPRADFAFADWRRAVFTSRVGGDLVGRSVIADSFFGPSRIHFENYTRNEPAFMEAGLRYFGGEPSLRPFFRAVLGAARYVAACVTRPAARTAPSRRDASAVPLPPRLR